MGARTAAVTAIVTANILGGVSYAIQKDAVAELPPATLSLLRNLVALAVLIPWAWSLRRRDPAWSGADRLRMLFLGVVAYGLPLWLGVVGVERSTAANGSILILLEPTTILLVAWLFMGEVVGRRLLIGAGICMAGALLLVLTDAPVDGLLEDEFRLGNALLALHGVLWGLHTPIARPVAARHDAITMTTWTLLLSLLVLAPVSWSEHASDPVDWNSVLAVWPALLMLGLGVSLGATLLWLYSLRTLHASRVAAFVFLQPVAGLLAGYLWLGERSSPQALVGAAIILVGVGLTVRPPRAARGTGKPVPG